MRRIVKSSNITIGEKREIGENIKFYGASETNEKAPQLDSDELDRSLKEKQRETENIIKARLEEANNQAKLIINEAYEDSRSIYENANTEGYDHGYTKGYQDGKAEAERIIQEALSIKKQIQENKEAMTKQLESEVINLVLGTTEKILGYRLEESKECILGLVKLGLDKCTYTDSLSVRVSPEDYEYVSSMKDRILCLAENIVDITVKPDSSLKKGSCILDTISGSIDSSIQTQLKHIREIFHELLESE